MQERLKKLYDLYYNGLYSFDEIWKQLSSRKSPYTINNIVEFFEMLSNKQLKHFTELLEDRL